MNPQHKIKFGDTLTISGTYEKVRNPHRRWWQIWKPRVVDGPQLRVLTVVGEAHGRK